jgi:hypothetical protein
MKLDVKHMLFLVAAVVVGSFAYEKVSQMINKDSFEQDDEM